MFNKTLQKSINFEGYLFIHIYFQIYIPVLGCLHSVDIHVHIQIHTHIHTHTHIVYRNAA